MGRRSRIIPIPGELFSEIDIRDSKGIYLASTKETRSFGRYAARFLSPGSVIALFGPLGAGKTSWVQGLAEGLQISVPIQSPTFSYLHSYLEGKYPLHHFDLYRMKSSFDFWSMGFEEYFEPNAITVIEWSERLEGSLSSQTLNLCFSYRSPGRDVHLSSAIDLDLVNSLTRWDL